MAPVPAGFSQVTASFTGVNLPYGAVVTLGTDIDPAVGGPSEALGAAAVILGNLTVEMCHTGVTLTQVELKIGPSSTGPTYSLATSVAGTVGGDGGSPNTAYLVRKRQLTSSARFSGRFYWPGVSEEVVNADGTIQPANITDFQTALDDAFEDWESTVGQMYVFNMRSEPPLLVNSLELQPVVATQRRRLRR